MSAEKGKIGRGNIATKYLDLFKDKRVIGLIALQVIMDGLSKQVPMTAVVMEISKRLEDELRQTKFDKEFPKESRWAMEKALKGKAYHRTRTVATYYQNKHGMEWTNWPKPDKVHLGRTVVDLIIQATGIIEMIRLPKKDKSVYYLKATAKTREWLEKYAQRSALMNPVNMPTLIPPRRFESATSGGYYTHYIPPLKLVKTRNKAYLEELDGLQEEMAPVYECVHALAETPWKVNTSILSIMDTLWNADSTLADLPHRMDKDLPPCPVCGRFMDDETYRDKSHTCFKDNPDALRAWKQKAILVHEFNASRWSKEIQTRRLLKVAHLYADEERFYFPYQLDFRGRVYAVPDYLNPQGSDKGKGLLLLAEGKPIDSEGADLWFCVHGANLYGYDKDSLDGRRDWAMEHKDEIISCATNPYENLWWAEADKPWQFLAWAMEFKGYTEQGKGFISHIPVAMDGTCNGLQHFSAMLRDEVGGRATNLIPSDKPQDIYGIVAKHTVQKLEHMIKTSDDDEEIDMANKWLAMGITRKTTKRPVMVLPYGGTLYSCREYVEDWLKEHLDICPWNPSRLMKPTQFLAKVIWEAIGETVISARNAMGWLQSVAKVVGSEGLPVSWTTPSGFPVQQAYYSTKSRLVKTRLAGQAISLSLTEETDKIDKRRQAQAVSPNFVHSLDASAMVFAVRLARKMGINSFAMVHDSYGTHASDAPALAQALREAFVEMYAKRDVLNEFRDHMIAMVSEENAKDICPIPPKGNLDIAEVKNSLYFFA